jgi:ubiquinone/menaquinone biosynthesis C-methylase UbiE
MNPAVSKPDPAAIEESFARRYQNLDAARAYDRDRFESESAKQRRDRNTQQAILRALREPGGIRSVLDLPCGTGRLTRLLLEAGFEYTGADQSEAMLTVAREKTSDLAGVSLVTADAAHLHFAEDSFDCVVCVRFLNLFPSEMRQPMLREMRRVSRRFLLAESRYSRELTWWRPLAAALRAKSREHYELDRVYWRDLAETGWKIHRLHHFKSRGLFSSTRVVTMLEKA